jgi:hypothetical protein
MDVGGESQPCFPGLSCASTIGQKLSVNDKNVFYAHILSLLVSAFGILNGKISNGAFNALSFDDRYNANSDE